MARERTFVMLKPDAIQRRLVGEIISRFERKGLKLVGIKMVWMTRSKAEELYAVHTGKPFFDALITFVTSSPVIVMVWEGENAVAAVRQLIGATKSIEADVGTVRGDLGLSATLNLIHGADSLQSAKREISLFFSEGEIFSYELCDEAWISWIQRVS